MRAQVKFILWTGDDTVHCDDAYSSRGSVGAWWLVTPPIIQVKEIIGTLSRELARTGLTVLPVQVIMKLYIFTFLTFYCHRETMTCTWQTSSLVPGTSARSGSPSTRRRRPSGRRAWPPARTPWSSSGRTMGEDGVEPDPSPQGLHGATGGAGLGGPLVAGEPFLILSAPPSSLLPSLPSMHSSPFFAPR